MALRIKEIIKEKGMTVQTLADKMGINRVGLSNHRMKILMDILRLGVKSLKSLLFKIWKPCLLVTNSLQNEKKSYSQLLHVYV